MKPVSRMALPRPMLGHPGSKRLSNLAQGSIVLGCCSCSCFCSCCCCCCCWCCWWCFCFSNVTVWQHELCPVLSSNMGTCNILCIILFGGNTLHWLLVSWDFFTLRNVEHPENSLNKRQPCLVIDSWLSKFTDQIFFSIVLICFTKIVLTYCTIPTDHSFDAIS